MGANMDLRTPKSNTNKKADTLRKREELETEALANGERFFTRTKSDKLNLDNVLTDLATGANPKDLINNNLAMTDVKKATKKSEPKKVNIHKDHRSRLKAQYIENGVEYLTDIQKLELLLFYALPQKDTNPLAHKLLDSFGSLKAVLNAEVKQLVKVPGIKESTAILINMVSGLMHCINMPTDNYFITSSSAARVFCSKLFHGVSVEYFYVVCLGKDNKVLKYMLIEKGSKSEAKVQIRDITEFAIDQKCNRILLAHNHPSGKAIASDEDIKFTYTTLCSCLINNIDILDHVIVGTDRSISMQEQGILDTLKRKVQNDVVLSNDKKLLLSESSASYKICDPDDCPVP